MSDNEIVPLLDKENFEHDRSQFVDASNSCHESPINPRRSLPPGKTYHIFISYSSHDQSYVLRLKNVLERLGFKCLLADHDFSYGVSVMRNIETTLQTCHKLLLVVSQHFLRSVMCDKEVDMAHKYSADIGRIDFMIVLRLDESKMPLKLDFMTYINGAELEVNVVGRKVEKAFDGFADVPVQQNLNGLEILRKQPTAKSRGVCGSSSYELCDLSKFDKETLKSWSVEESPICYREIMEDANGHFLLRRYAVFVCGRKLFCFGMLLVLGNVTFLLSMYVLLTILTGANTSPNDLLLIAFGTFGLTIGLHAACTVYLFNQIYLEERARECWPQDSEESIAEKCKAELLTTILGSFKGFDLSLIPKATSIRHSTYNNSCCLCQLAKSPWTYRNSILNVIPDPEINQTEETCVMTIAESESVQETFVKGAFEIEHEYIASAKENDETSALKILCNSQESNSFDTLGVGAVSGSLLTEPANGLPLTGAEGGTFLRGAEGGTFLRGGESGSFLRGEESGSFLRGEEAGTLLRGEEGGTFLRGAEGGTFLNVAEGASLGSSLDYNIDQWYGDMCKTHVRGEATSEQQPQVSHELITLETHPVSLADSEMSTSLNDPEEVIGPESGEQEMQCFRGEYSIDETTHAKLPV